MRSNITTRSILRFGAVAILAGSLALSGASVASAAPAGALVAGEVSVSGATAASGKLKLKVTSRPAKNTEVGKLLVFKGTAPSKLKRKTVMLQLKVGTKWQTVAKSRITSKRTFKVQARATKAGAQRYRVAVAATRRTPAAASSSFGYTVWAWYGIAGDSVSSSRLYRSNGDASIGGRNYPESVVFGWTGYSVDGWAEYNVNYRCTQFRATIGLLDSSKSGSTRSFSLGVDSISVQFGTRGVGAGLPVKADIAGAYRIKLNTLRDGNSIAGYATFGTPQVYCSSAP